MKEIQTYTGYWFIPDNNRNKWSGTLTITQESRILLEFIITREELIKVVPEVFQQIQSVNNQLPIRLVNGYAKNQATNKDFGITLIDLELISYSESGLIVLTLEAKYCLNHYQIQNQNHLLFTNLMLKLDGFDDWMNKFGFNVNNEHDPKVFSTEITFSPPEPIMLLENKDLNIYFFFRAKSPGFVNGPKAEMEQSVYLNIEYKKAQNIEVLVNQIEKIQNLFTLINNYPTQRSHCQTKIKHDKRNTIPNIGDREIDFIFKETVPDFSKHINRGSALFSYTKVESQFPDIFQNWINIYEIYEPALDQYFDTLYFNQGHIVSRFVNILSVLEIYHSRKFNQEISLKAKIKDLILQLTSINEKHFNFSDDFVEEIILIRKFYVHGTEVKTKLTDAMQQKANISKHIRSLETIFRIHLLIELGLCQEDISKMIERKPWQWGKINN